MIKNKKPMGKQKGSAFERDICKRLSLWISNGNRKDIFWRSAMSGGRATIQLVKGEKNKSQTGDISSIDFLGQKLTDNFIIECKFYRNIHLESLVYGAPKTASILEFWKRLKRDCERFNKKPILIFKENGKEILIGTSWRTMAELAELASIELFKSKSYFDPPDVYIMTLDDFLKIDPERLELL
jgi:hypothetical protein